MFYILLLCLWIWAFAVLGVSNVSFGSDLNVLDLYMKYKAERVPLLVGTLNAELRTQKIIYLTQILHFVSHLTNI